MLPMQRCRASKSPSFKAERDIYCLFGDRISVSVKGASSLGISAQVIEVEQDIGQIFAVFRLQP